MLFPKLVIFHLLLFGPLLQWTYKQVAPTLIAKLFLKLPFIRGIFRNAYNDKYLYTAFCGLFIFMDIFNSFNARTSRLNILSNILKNKVFVFIMLFVVTIQILLIYYGGELFRTTGLTIKEFIVMLVFSFSVIPFDILRKVMYKRKNKTIDV